MNARTARTVVLAMLECRSVGMRKQHPGVRVTSHHRAWNRPIRLDNTLSSYASCSPAGYVQDERRP